MSKPKHERRQLTVSQKAKLRDLRQQLKICKSMRYTTSATALRGKIRAILSGADIT